MKRSAFSSHRTERRDASRLSDPYYRLDNSAILTAAIADRSGPFVFRLTCTLDHTVDLGALGFAMARLAPRFPCLNVRMGHGVFWHYLDPLRRAPVPEAERVWPAEPMPYRRNQPLFRVMAYGRRIACEFHHAITDGTGAMAYLRALVCDYFVQKGVELDSEELTRMGIAHADEPVSIEECEDAYARYFTHPLPPPPPRPQAFQLPGYRRHEGYRETVGSTPLAAIHSQARSRSTSITGFVAAVYLAALQDVYEAMPPGPRRRASRLLSVQIPVNLRTRYPSRSVRNFTLLASATLDLGLGHWNFDEILARVHHELGLGVSNKELARQLGRNVAGERNALGRPLFLPLKSLVLRRINAVMGVGTYSGSVSNLGQVTLPEAVASRVLSIGFLPARSAAACANLGVISWRDTLYLSIGSLAMKRDLERLVFTRLASLGLEFSVACNEAFERERP